MDTREFHPVQANWVGAKKIRADEVYSHVFGAQPAMVDLAGRGCRGGFGVEELIAFLYAYPFPKSEWRARVDEAFDRGV